MENFRDKARAYLLALLVHLGVAAMLMVSLLWTESVKPISLPGPVIEAELVGPSSAPPARVASKPKPTPPKPVVQPPPEPETPPEPPKPEPPKPEPAPPPLRNDRIDREKVAEMAQQKAEKAERAEEERRRAEQVLLDQQERERQKQLEAAKREHAEAVKKVKLEKEKLAQLQDLQKAAKAVRPPAQPVPESDQAKTGTNGSDDSLQAQYFAAIQNAVTTNWLRPDSAQPGVSCMIRIVQIIGGDVISVEVTNPCNADPLTRNSIEQAVKRAAPLPYKGYEKEFRREIKFNFSYEG